MLSSIRNRFLASFTLNVIIVTIMMITGCSAGSNGGMTSTLPPAPSGTITTVSATPTATTSGAAVAFAITVKLASGLPASGTVTINEGASVLGSIALDAAGAGSLSIATLPVGTHSITAAFAGSATQVASNSSAVTITIAAPPTIPTVSNVNTPGSQYGGYPIEIGAYITPSSGPGAGVPTGTVTFSDQSGPIGTTALDPFGLGHITLTTLSPGPHDISVAYNGDATYLPSHTSSLSMQIEPVSGSSFTNPLKLNLPMGGPAVSCADPSIIKAQTGGQNIWYLYCTSDALYSGDPNPHYINVFESADLVNWNYDGNAFAGLPSWAPQGQLWAPAIKYFNGQYYLYYASPTSNQDAAGGAAIGVGISSSPKGPFVDHGSPVVEPEPTVGNCCGGHDRSTIDPDVVQDTGGQRYISFGSFDGGIFVRKLSSDGFTSDKTSEVQIGATNRYEGGAMWQHGSYWYLFASSANCCNGPLTGYSVFVGRANSPMGPFVDSRGVSMTDVNAGGDEILAQTGNRWIGPGGNVLFSDEAGQDYILYHAVPSDAPVYTGTTSYTVRQALIDPVYWDPSSGWPFINKHLGPSAAQQPIPAAQPGDSNANPTSSGNAEVADLSGHLYPSLSDEFNTGTLSPQWSSLHSTPAYTLANGAINLPTVNFDSCCQMGSLPMLVEDAPTGDYEVETRITINLPPTGSGANFAQGDLFIYGDDQDFLRLDIYANAATRQIEFIKQITPIPTYAATHGASNLPAPSVAGGVVTAYLRIVKRTIDNQATYTAYTNWQGPNYVWQRGATWTHALKQEKIGIAGGNLSGYTVSFDYVHVSTIR